MAELEHRHLDMRRGLLDFPRPKTAIERRAILWPETMQAIREAVKVRPEPKDPVNSSRVFLTRFGHPWVRIRETDRSVGTVDSV